MHEDLAGLERRLRHLLDAEWLCEVVDDRGPVGLGQRDRTELRAGGSGEDGLEEGVHGQMLPVGKSAVNNRERN